MFEINGHHPRQALPLRQRRRNLEHPQSSNQIDAKGRTHWVTLVAHPVNLAPGFAQQGIIHGHDQRFLGGQSLFQGLANQAKDGPFIKAVLGVETVIG